MGKKTKNRKKIKKADQELQYFPVDQLIRKGRAAIAGENYRQAIQVLKAAQKKDHQNHEIRPLLFRAYISREDQLRRKAMHKEADALHHQTLQYLPDMAQMEISDLLICLNATSPDKSISLYSRFLSHRKPSPEAETVIAGRLLASDNWQIAADIPDHALLKPELPLLREAARHMNGARWETALACLQTISRNSPLAPVRMLCRAMVCFHENDDPGMQRALSMIPASFPLFPLVDRLKTAPQSLAPLWQGHRITPDQIQFIIRAVKRRNIGGAGREIKKIALAIRPDAPFPAIEQMLIMLWPMVLTETLDTFDLEQMAETLLPEESKKVLAAKFYFLEFEELLHDTDTYLQVLDKEFADPEDRATAASMVLSDSVARIATLDISCEAFSDLPKSAGQRLGLTLPADQSDLALLEMVIKALELDPRNPECLDLLIRLPRASRKAKQLVETGLLKIIENLPDDPRPCIALADLCHEKNAFRQAEQWLRKAELLAPHDDQVKESRVQSLLRSIDSNLKRNKQHLVKQDLEKAARLCGKTTHAHVAARQILFDIEQTGQMTLFNDRLVPEEKGRIRAAIEQRITGLSGAESLKVLAILRGQCRQCPKMWNNAQRESLKTVSRLQAQTLDTLPSRQIRDLLLADHATLTSAGGPEHWLSDLLEHHKNILQKINDEDILPVLEALFGAGHSKACLKEIRRRLKTSPEPFQNLLRFYQMVMSCITGQQAPETEAFEKLVEAVPAQQREMLRSACRRLSKGTHGALKIALEQFTFDLLDQPCNCPACTGLIDPEEDDIFSAEDIFLSPNDLQAANPLKLIIDDLEDLVDTANLRGAPSKVVKKRRKDMLNNYHARTLIKALAENFPKEMAFLLSPEARIILFG